MIWNISFDLSENRFKSIWSSYIKFTTDEIERFVFLFDFSFDVEIKKKKITQNLFELKVQKFHWKFEVKKRFWIWKIDGLSNMSISSGCVFLVLVLKKSLFDLENGIKTTNLTGNQNDFCVCVCLFFNYKIGLF